MDVPIGETKAASLLADRGHQQATTYLRHVTTCAGIGRQNAADLGQPLQHNVGTSPPHDVYPILMETLLTILRQSSTMEG